jgi:hypothetical protein
MAKASIKKRRTFQQNIRIEVIPLHQQNRHESSMYQDPTFGNIFFLMVPLRGASHQALSLTI